MELTLKPPCSKHALPPFSPCGKEFKVMLVANIEFPCVGEIE